MLDRQAVLAEGRELDEEVERRADLLSEPGEHAFVKVRPGSDGRADLLQLCLHGRRSRLRPWPSRSVTASGSASTSATAQGVVFYANYLMYFDVAMTELWREAAAATRG